MATVPHDPDLLETVLDNRHRIGRRERECGGGETVSSEDETNVGDGDEPLEDGDGAATTVERVPIIFLEGLQRASGKETGGAWRKVGDCKIIGLGVDPDTYVATTVQLRGTYARTAGVVATANAEMFRLPPGWWPADDVVHDLGAQGQVTIYGGAGLVVYQPPETPFSPAPIVLDGIEFDGGVGSCPGFEANPTAINEDDTIPDDPDSAVTTLTVTSDPTGAGDGRQWDSCSQTPDALAGGGAAAGFAWTDMAPGESGIEVSGGAQWTKYGEVYLTRGNIVDTVPETHAGVVGGTVVDHVSITGPDIPADFEAPGVIEVYTDADTSDMLPCFYALSSAYITVIFKRASLSGIDRLFYHLDGLVFPPSYPN